MTAGRELGMCRCEVNVDFAERGWMLLILLKLGQVFHYYLVIR